MQLNEAKEKLARALVLWMEGYNGDHTNRIELSNIARTMYKNPLDPFVQSQLTNMERDTLRNLGILASTQI